MWVGWFRCYDKDKLIPEDNPFLCLDTSLNRHKNVVRCCKDRDLCNRDLHLVLDQWPDDPGTFCIIAVAIILSWNQLLFIAVTFVLIWILFSEPWYSSTCYILTVMFNRAELVAPNASGGDSGGSCHFHNARYPHCYAVCSSLSPALQGLALFGWHWHSSA